MKKLLSIGAIKKTIFLILILLLIISGGGYLKNNFFTPSKTSEEINKEVKQLVENNQLKNGDIIFQTSISGQSRAIQIATKSQYSHCGIIFKDKGQYYVYEAVQPVKVTPLDIWIARGKNGHYVVKRIKNAEKILTEGVIQKLKKEGQKYLGKNYDIYFNWSDDQIYCSELVWKIYKNATGIEIGKLEKLGDFDLSSKVVKDIIKKRYRKNIPLNETVISPESIYSSDLLTTVKRS